MNAKSTDTPSPGSPAALARDWTARGWPCSRQYADKMIKAGCPTSSFDDAWAWRTARTGRHAGGSGGAGARSEKAAPLARAEPPAEILGEGLDAVLARARQAEREQYRTYLEAVKVGDLGLQSMAAKAHKDSQKNMIEVESLVFAAKRERGEYVCLPVAQQRIDDRLAPLKAARQQISRTLALSLFPDNPARAQPRIEAELCRILDAAVANAGRPLVESAPAMAPAAASAAASNAA